MRAIFVAGAVFAITAGGAGGANPQPLPAKPGLAAKPPKPAPAVASTPESRTAAELALGSDPVFDDGTYLRIKQMLLSYSAIQVRGGWPSLPADTKLAPGASGPDVALLRKRLVLNG